MQLIVYKNIIIETYKGSNYAYIGNRVFNNLLSAKRHITKTLGYFDNDTDKVLIYYFRK